HPPEISNVTSVPPVFVQKLPQNYLYYIIPFYSRFYLCMQKFTCGSNAHNSPSFITHPGLWAWTSPHPLPSACLLSLSRERFSRELTMIAKEVQADQLLWSTYNTLNDVNYDVIQYFTRMHPHIYFTPFRISTSNPNMITQLLFATLVTSIYNNYPNNLLGIYFTLLRTVIILRIKTHT